MIEPAPLHRWEELLADRTGGCLPHEERRELERLLADDPSIDPTEFDEAAGALLLACSPPATEEVPSHLRLRLQASADAWFAGAPPSADSARPPRGSLLSSPWSGWIAAAAVALLAAGPLVFGGGGDPSAVDPAADRSELLAREDIGYWEFEPTEDPIAAGVGGDVVWSTEEQRGYMLFRGLEPNDPEEAQYQLWIFDGSRAENEPDTPVDGGVFDVAASGDVIVPIDPKLEVGAPALFAITLERPGGVVVSKRENLLLLASTNS